MVKGPKGFSNEEKQELRNKLCTECERSWALHGYKKTSVGEMASKIGISTGAFYLLYSSKEDLFCETLERVQCRLRDMMNGIIRKNPTKEGFALSLKSLFREYDSTPFLYDVSNPDFLSFINKLPRDKVEKLEFDNLGFFNDAICYAKLILKVEEEKAYAVFSALLYTVSAKENLRYDHAEVFDFIIDGIMDDLFE
ncbi:TetR/AcrR family transcriptional regulator [uncultured Clostridium sp.]|uniref:TetR/AcrR family transcriptional regulator n=1 Tax=uncultured Clostridium sp. TaxID=59620 RepID=UPI0028E7D2CB|nr:TetR/AcrR family transcriptional regulator [uncultured Clostridium sp.]